MEFNCYEILELDANEKKIVNIAKQFEDKKREWNKWKSQGTPKQQELAKTYSENIKEIEKIINDKEELKLHRDIFIKRQKQFKKEFFNELDSMIAVLSSNEISESESKTLINHFKNKLTSKEITNRLSKRGVIKKKTTSTTSKRVKKETIDSSKLKEINDLLSFFDKKTLYDFLIASKNSSTLVLKSKADDILTQARGKTDTQNSRKAKIAGLIKDIFKDETNKDKYDNSLSRENLKVLDSVLKMAGADKVLTQEKIGNILKIAKKNSIHKDDAIEYIEEVSGKRKWVIVGGNTFQHFNLLECGFCGDLSDKEKQKKCKGCGEDLIQPCPICTNPTPTEQSACSKCGCKTGDRKEVELLMKEAEAYITQEKYLESKLKLNKVLSIWRKWDKAEKKLKKIGKIEQEKKKIFDKVSNLIKKRQYVEANIISNTHNIVNFKKDIETNLTQAKSLVLQADKEKNKNYDKAIELYEKALFYVSDFEIAIKALKSIPLPAVINLKHSIEKDKLTITWDKANISYVVVKNITIPQNSSDGIMVVDTSANIAIDILSEELYYYAIFPKKNVVYETPTIIGPFFYPQDVKHYTYNVTSKQINIEWSLPKNCKNVEIYKKKGNGIKKNEGIRLTHSLTSLIDNDVRIDTLYSYFLIAVYKNKNQFFYSEGISIVITPTELPLKINNLKADITDDTIFLSWENIKDKINIKKFETKPLFKEGEVISLQKMEKNGKNIMLQTQNSTQLNTLSTTTYFVPFSIKYQTVMVGNIIKVSTIKDVTNVKTYQVGDKIILTFLPPNGAKDFWIVYRYDRFVKDIFENKNMFYKFNILEYEKDKKIELPIQEETNHYITIYTYDTEENTFSNGVEVLENAGDEIIVKYFLEIKKQWLLTGKRVSAKIVLKTTEDTVLNDIVVVFKQNTVPLNINDGVVIKNMKTIKFENRQAMIYVPPKYLNEEGYLKLFFKNQNKAVRLLPSAEKLIKL